MPKPSPSIIATFTRLANAIADVVAHPDCPVEIANDLVDLAMDWDNKYSAEITRAEDAHSIRRNVPKWLRQAVKSEQE